MMPTALRTLAAADGGSHEMLLTMVTAISAGVLLITIARRLRLPGLVMLLAGGVVLGPTGLGLVQPASLGDGLLAIVSFAIGLILFEGGLTLDTSGYRSAPRMIKRLLTVGVLTTWLVTAAAVRLVVGLEWPLAIAAASLVIVTGPTVIAPLLKRVRATEKIASILHWEGVLIDPIGVFVAVLCFEWISGAGGGEALANLAVRVGAGLAIGVVGGLLIAVFVRRKVFPEDMVNVASLACAVLVFGVGEAVRSETGLLAVTVAGFVFGLSGSHGVKQVRRFKAELTDLLIGTLFILLAARLEFGQFSAFGWSGVLVVVIVMLVVRPLSIGLCSLGVGLTPSEKVFLSWIAPRGIVAASMASLFAIRLEAIGTFDNPRFIETFTYSVIIATVVLQGLTAVPLARMLGVRRPDPTGWLIVGAHTLARRIARFIATAGGLDVVLIDTNKGAVAAARREGLLALAGDARDAELRDDPRLQGVGNMLALTDNEDLNARLCQTWARALGGDHVFRCNPTGVEPTEGDEFGTIVWPRLPRPSLLAGEIIRGESVVIEAKPGTGAVLARRATPIAVVGDDGRVSLAPPADDATSGAALYLRRSAEYLRRGLRDELVLTVDAPDVASLIGAIVDRVVAVEPAVPRDATVRDLLEREKTLPSALGYGVAVPHAYTEGIESRLCAIARVPAGVDFGARDGEPVRLVFLLLSPSGDPEGHLATLAEIARLLVAAEVRDRLIEVEEHEVIGVVTTARRGD
jgi:NhaP-type Na+/H+ or K+/H+ antiporter/mannitol/fructose-specific phosphotransferase system IIA component (Ntr-type)